MESAKYIRFYGFACLLLMATGCSICADCDLDAYNAYGGRWQRTERDAGRVGSVFHPAGALVPYGPQDANNPNSVLAPAEEEPEVDAEQEEDIRREGLDFDFGPGMEPLEETSLQPPSNY